MMALRILGVPAGTSVQPWGVAGPAGYTNPRPATQLLMSAYDTNPTSTDQTGAFQAALAAAAAITATGLTQVDILLDSRQAYQIGGAVTAGAQGQWCQVAIPWSTTHKSVIRLVGMPMSAADNFYSNTSGTVIESTLASAPAYSARPRRLRCWCLRTGSSPSPTAPLRLGRGRSFDDRSDHNAGFGSQRTV